MEVTTSDVNHHLLHTYSAAVSIANYMHSAQSSAGHQFAPFMLLNIINFLRVTTGVRDAVQFTRWNVL